MVGVAALLPGAGVAPVLAASAAAGRLAAADPDGGPTLLQAVWLGLVEGLTEFLPVSSTGHLIVVQRWLGLGESPANNLFAVGIQMGAITAILVLYWRRLLAALLALRQPLAGAPNLWLQIAVAAAPAVVLGLLLNRWIDAHLFSPWVVASTMLLGGLVLLWLERSLRGRAARLEDLPAVGYRTALWIGCWQCLALLPGTSRSAATLGGALWLGLSRPAAAEFSFLVGLPILYGAAALKLWQGRALLDGPFLLPFAVGSVVAFASAIVVVRPFVAFVRRRDFTPFAWYRVAAGGLLFALCAAGWLA
ncbi:MAG: undecaprenyl-diphosphate phosphatase [Planctomycetes bacterium]|nr:undecaprenyl-diphosphate phosphatase [Planctomycetota bacterium]